MFVVRPVARATSRPVGGGKTEPPFDIASLFKNGEQGFWFDPNDLNTLFQDAAGTVPVTAAGQPVGLILDKSKGLVLGSELIINNEFDTPANWVLTSGIAISGGKLNITASVGGAATQIFRSYKQSGWYEIRLKVDSISSSDYNVRFLSTSSVIVGSATYKNSTGEQVWKVLATAPFDRVVIQCGGGVGLTATIDSISVKELHGNHAYQTVSASRPTLSSRVNMLTGTDTLANWSFVNTAKDGNAVKAKGAVSVHHITHSSFTYVPSSTITYYVEVTKGTGFCFFQLCYSNSNRVKCTINLATGENFVKKLSTNTTTVVVEDGGDVWRLSFTGSATGTSGTAYANMGFATSLKDDVCNAYDEPIFLANGSESMTIKAIDVRETHIGSNLPKYQRVTSSTDYDSVGFPNYLVFDGVDDFLQTSNIDFTTTDKVSLFAGVRKLSDATRGVVFEFGSSSLLSGSFGLHAPNYTNQPSVAFSAKGTLGAAFSYILNLMAPLSFVVTAKASIPDDAVSLKVNNLNQPISTDLGVGNFGNHPLYIGRREGKSLPFKGHIYGLIAVGKLTSDDETGAIEKELAKRVGVTLNV